MKRVFPLILLSVLLLAACRPAPLPTQVAAQTAPAPTLPTVTPTLAPLPTLTLTPPALSLRPCSLLSGAAQGECGVLRVKEDRSSPNSRELRLYMVVVRAREKNAAPDPLFFLAGGPGGVATESIANVLNIFLEINRKHDIVFIDQRGTNDLHKLECTAPTFGFADAAQEQVNAFAKQCLSEIDLDPRFYTTAAYAQDLEEARALLGYDTINLYGVSYGVTSAQVYMRMYESRVRSAVLDHGSFLDLPMFENWAHNSQLALDRVFARCEKDPACKAAYPDVRGDWQAIQGRLEKGPVTVDITVPGTTEKMQVTRADLDGIHFLLVDAKKAASIPQILHILAATEDWTPVIKGLMAAPSDSGDGELNLLYYTTVCYEGWAGHDEQDIARESAGSYLLDWNLRDARGTTKMCSAMPKAEPSALYGAGRPAQTPVLILSGEADPQNPPENMALAASFWPNSRQVIEPGLGHNTPVTSCRWDVMAQFIDKGTAQGIDVSCMTNAPTEPFVIGK